MKKIITLCMVMLVGIFALTGCNKEEVTTIGIVQIVEHPSLDTIRESFIAELESQGYKNGENIKIDYQNAQNDQSNLNAICNKFVGNQVDLIVAIATPSAQAAAAATKDIPIIFSAVTDPVAAGLATDKNKPDTNITGTSDAIPVDQVFELAKSLTPDVKKFGFLYTASEVNSKAVVEEAKKVASDYGYTYEEMTIINTSELSQAASSLVSKVDAIYTPIDNSIASAMPVLAEIGREAGIPVYVGADSMVMDGGYATIGINYQDLGAKTAQMAAEVLKGTAIADLPVATLDNFQKVINKTTAESIGAPSEAPNAIIVE